MKLVDDKTTRIQSGDQFQQWKSYFDVAHQLSHEGDNQTINLNLNTLMSQQLDEFWRYNGSLTTPPCTENVIWTIFRSEILLVASELDSFRHDLFFESYRGPQFLFYRRVERSFSEEIVPRVPDELCCIDSLSTRDRLSVIVLLLCSLVVSSSFFV